MQNWPGCPSIGDLERAGPKTQATDAILVTGDIAFSGSEGQYVSAKAWLLDLATRTGVSPDRIFVVPGENDTLRLRVWPRRWSEKNKFFTLDKDTTPKDRDHAEHPLSRLTFTPPPRRPGTR
jgi:hypothetical protein